jgi:carboxypeptidase C (cathepsin A)
MMNLEITVKSATYAMKGKQLLQQYNIRSHVGKRSGDNGCYYYLNVAEKHLSFALQVLQENQILK